MANKGWGHTIEEPGRWPVFVKRPWSMMDKHARQAAVGANLPELTFNFVGCHSTVFMTHFKPDQPEQRGTTHRGGIELQVLPTLSGQPSKVHSIGTPTVAEVGQRVQSTIEETNAA
eukprot:4568745-Prorocentrum_lima.AAC.1